MNPDALRADALDEKVRTWCMDLEVDTGSIPPLAQSALLVVDMQKDFLLEDGLLPVWGGPAVIDRLARVVDAFRDAARPVFFSRHVYDDPTWDGGETARWWGVDKGNLLLREGTWHSEIHPAFRPDPDDRVIKKRRYSAFFGTELERLLLLAGIRQVVIGGVCTNICCQATAHDAFFRDFEVYFLIDGNGATDEDAQVATLKNISLSYGRLVLVNQAIQALSR